MHDPKAVSTLSPARSRRTTVLVKTLDAQLQSLTGDYSTLVKLNVAQKTTIINWRAEARALRAQLIREQVKHAAVQKTQARLEGRIEELESLVKSQEDAFAEEDTSEDEDNDLAYLHRASRSTYIFGSCKSRRVGQLMRTQRAQRAQIADRDDEIMRLTLHRSALNAELTTVTAGLQALQKVAMKQNDQLRGQSTGIEQAEEELELLKLSAEVWRLDAEYWKAEAMKARGITRAMEQTVSCAEQDDMDASAEPATRVVL
ncbi:unnamed protein product [Peniophora sp. CBMAI 1063]|nr:unnamed protein product [Peniophora sp. CBMAI 1063]